MTAKDRMLDKVRVLTKTTQSVVSLGQDAKGDLYYVGYEGNIYKLDLDSRFRVVFALTATAIRLSAHPRN